MKKSTKQQDFLDVQKAIDKLSSLLQKYDMPYLFGISHPNERKTTIALGGSFVQMREIIDELMHQILLQCEVDSSKMKNSLDTKRQFSSEEPTIH